MSSGSARFVEWLDARETLPPLWKNRQPKRELFMATVGSVFERLLKKREYLVVRAYGEMVDLLASEGNVEGAIQLEGLWNELADRYQYSLLCGYSLEKLVHEAGEDGCRRVLRQHTHALPPEEVNAQTAQTPGLAHG